jgi:flagellar motor protein MotB
VEELADTYFNDALDSFSENDLAGAARRLECFLSLNDRHVEAHLLLGQIRMRQGRREDAVHCWTRVAELAPDSQDAKLLLAAAQREDRHRRTWKIVAPSLIFFLIVIAFFYYRTRNERRLRTLETQLAALKSQSPSLPARRNDLKVIAQRFSSVQGLTVKCESDVAVLTFSEGLFEPASDVLTAQARSLLSNFGFVAERLDKPLCITIEGHTNDWPVSPSGRWGDNWTLGLARASAAALYLKRHHQLARTRLQLRSAGGSATPFPNDTAENRRKNQTVVLYLSIESQGNGF